MHHIDAGSRDTEAVSDFRSTGLRDADTVAEA
jgi:hypothetical protein